MGKRKTTVYVDEDLLRHAHVYAARTGKRDSQVVEEALRSLLGIDVLERVWARSDLNEEQALDLAYEALHATRSAHPEPGPRLDGSELNLLKEIASGRSLDQIAVELDVPTPEIRGRLEALVAKLFQVEEGAAATAVAHRDTG